MKREGDKGRRKRRERGREERAKKERCPERWSRGLDLGLGKINT